MGDQIRGPGIPTIPCLDMSNGASDGASRSPSSSSTCCRWCGRRVRQTGGGLRFRRECDRLKRPRRRCAADRRSGATSWAAAACGGGSSSDPRASVRASRGMSRSLMPATATKKPAGWGGAFLEVDDVEQGRRAGLGVGVNVGRAEGRSAAAEIFWVRVRMSDSVSTRAPVKSGSTTQEQSWSRRRVTVE